MAFGARWLFVLWNCAKWSGAAPPLSSLCGVYTTLDQRAEGCCSPPECLPLFVPGRCSCVYLGYAWSSSDLPSVQREVHQTFSRSYHLVLIVLRDSRKHTYQRDWDAFKAKKHRLLNGVRDLIVRSACCRNANFDYLHQVAKERLSFCVNEGKTITTS